MEFLKRSLVSTLFLSASAFASQTAQERELSSQLTQAVAMVNKGAGTMLDEETRLDSAATFSNYIIYTNTMVNYTADQLDPIEFSNILNEIVIKPLCTTKGLEGFIETGVIMVYRYLDKNGKFISELSKDMSTCE